MSSNLFHYTLIIIILSDFVCHLLHYTRTVLALCESDIWSVRQRLSARWSTYISSPSSDYRLPTHLFLWPLKKGRARTSSLPERTSDWTCRRESDDRRNWQDSRRKRNYRDNASQLFVSHLHVDCMFPSMLRIMLPLFLSSWQSHWLAARTCHTFLHAVSLNSALAYNYSTQRVCDKRVRGGLVGPG